MYFPSGVAKVLSYSNDRNEPILSIAPNARKTLYLSLTSSTLSLWRIRPAVLLATLERTEVSLKSHGHNVQAHWSPDSERIVIQTSASHLVLIRVQRADYTPYNISTVGPGVSRRFQLGAGEGIPLAAYHLTLQGVVGIHGGLVLVSPRETHILFSTRDPPAVQRIPWPGQPPSLNDDDDDDSEGISRPVSPSLRRSIDGDEDAEAKDKWLGHDTWFIEHDELPWLISSRVTVSYVNTSRTTGYEGWITSDGRAYLVYLFEEDDGEGDGNISGRSVSEAPDGTAADSDKKSSNSNARSNPISESRAPPSETPASSNGSDSPDLSFNWDGVCVHGQPDVDTNVPVPTSPSSVESTSTEGKQAHDPVPLPIKDRATRLAFNGPFSLLAVGTSGGAIHISDLPTSGVTAGQIQTLQPPTTTSTHRLMQSSTPHHPSSSTESSDSSLETNAQQSHIHTSMGAVTCLEWTSDGYALAVGWERGWAIFTVGGRCICSSVSYEGERGRNAFDDAYMDGVIGLMWLPGNFELLLLAASTRSDHSHVRGVEATPQLFSLPFAKNAVTNQHSPDNTRYGVLVVDSGVMIYRGADQPDLSIINPEADVWQHVKIPPAYMSLHWPIRYASISNDGRLLAIAGRRGLLHWSAVSGRWKTFSDPHHEQAFAVRGGMVWFNHVLVAACESGGQHEVRLYSRDLDLSPTTLLHVERLTAPIVVLSLVDNSLLVYTSDNTIHHFLILTTHLSVKLRLCGSISFDGVIGQPSAVRGLSWMIPKAQKELGDPVDDLAVAAVLMLLGGRLILLRPRKVGPHEVKYDMQILHERIEFCWIHLTGIGALENSLWGYDGTGMRIWLDALTIESAVVNQEKDAYQSVKESVNIPLNFYPVSCLMEKGVIIGVEHEAATRVTLPFVMFRTVTSTHLFLHHVLLYHLRRSQLKESISFAVNYQSLVFFAHALEILLHTVLEADVDTPSNNTRDMDILPLTIEFIDHFESCLEVVVGCARKTEMSRWRKLFDIVGNPKDLFETCLQLNQLKTAGSYLLVLHNLEQLDQQHEDAIRLLQRAIQSSDWTLSRELLHFLRSIDESGASLSHALQEVGLANDIEATSL